MKNKIATIIVVLFLIVIGILFLQDKNKTQNTATFIESSLPVGKSVTFGALTLTFNGLLNDYRCPVDTTCMEGGAVNTNVTFTVGNHTETKNMPSDEVPQIFDGYGISIIKVSPDTKNKVTINPKDYVVTFRIEKK